MLNFYTFYIAYKINFLLPSASSIAYYTYCSVQIFVRIYMQDLRDSNKTTSQSTSPFPAAP